MVRLTKKAIKKMVGGYVVRYVERTRNFDVDGAWKLRFECCSVHFLCHDSDFYAMVDRCGFVVGDVVRVKDQIGRTGKIASIDVNDLGTICYSLEDGGIFDCSEIEMVNRG